jgi:hypothetical protein
MAHLGKKKGEFYIKMKCNHAWNETIFAQN